MKHLSVILTLLALLVVGCTGGKGTGDFKEMKFSLTGGIAGFNKWVAVAADGSYQIVDREQEVRRGKLPGTDLAALKEKLAKVQWAQLQAQYADPKVADAMFETVTVTVGDRTYTTVVGTGGTPPAELGDLVRWLKMLLATPQHGN